MSGQFGDLSFKCFARLKLRKLRFETKNDRYDIALGLIASDGLVAARLDSNRHIHFNASEHRHFDHGYAVTSHSAQGITAERVLVNADTGVHPNLLNSRFGYVAMSRASHDATLFTNDMTKLTPKLSTDVSKSSAIEIRRTPSIVRGIGMDV